MSREKIREGIFKIILDNCWTSESEEACILGASLRIMEYLHSRGVKLANGESLIGDKDAEG